MFRKYFSIDNSYRQKEIDYWLERFPELETEDYIIQVKIDGANISLVFESDGTWSIVKRSGIVGPKENFYNIQFIVETKYMDVVDVLKKYAKETESTLNVYCEVFGTGIQKRINYGDGKFLLAYDMIINDVLLTPWEMEDMFSLLNIEDFLIPSFGIVKGLQEALDFNVEDVKSLVYPEGGDNIEGVVIKPYNKIYSISYGEDTPTTKIGNVFYLKKKGEKFGEVKPKRERKPVDDKLVELQEGFKDYITKNRLLSVFSKHGEISNPKQIGKYIKYVLNDAKEEFDKDYIDELQGLKKKELQYVYNVSKIVVEMLGGYL